MVATEFYSHIVVHSSDQRVVIIARVRVSHHGSRTKSLLLASRIQDVLSIHRARVESSCLLGCQGVLEAIWVQLDRLVLEVRSMLLSDNFLVLHNHILVLVHSLTVVRGEVLEALAIASLVGSLG